MLVSVLTTAGCGSCLHAHYVIGQDQDKRSIGTCPNQGREPPLVWSVEFMKKVHVASNDTAPLGFPFVACDGPSFPPADSSSIRPNRAALLGPTMPLGTKEWSLRGCLSACNRISSGPLHADGHAELCNRRVYCLGAHLIDRIRRGRNPPHQKIAARRCV